MAELGGDGGGNGGGDGGDRPVVVEAEGLRIDDQTTGEAPTGTDAEVRGTDGGGDGHAATAGDGDERCAPVDLGRTPVVVGSEGPRVERLDPRSSVEGSVVTGGVLVGASSSGSGVGVGEDRPGSPPRDPTSGKAPAVVEEEGYVPRADHAERIEFMAPAGSSSHEPIMSRDLAEFVGEFVLARLMRENPEVVAVVERAREERLREIARSDEAERLRREAEAAEREQAELVRETEEAEREQEEGPGAYEVAVDLAETRRSATRAPFVAETYVLPEPHVFVASGTESYVPLQRDYDEELVLRDREQHLSRGWTEVYL